MKRPMAIAGSAAFLLIAPGIVAGVVPWLLTGRYSTPVTSSPTPAVPGGVLILGGIALLLDAFVRFALEGEGTPAPVAPTERLVVGGVYRFVRNPMYLAVIAIIVGQALLFTHGPLFAYAAAAAAAMFAFVRLYEEPTLRSRYGSAYERYRRAVPGWVPRVTPWRGD